MAEQKTVRGDLDVKDWHTIWPIYINSKKTIADGRRMPMQFCVEDPTLQDFVEICAKLRIPFIVEVLAC